jgi:hypothetical protein
MTYPTSRLRGRPKWTGQQLSQRRKHLVTKTDSLIDRQLHHDFDFDFDFDQHYSVTT